MARQKRPANEDAPEPGRIVRTHWPDVVDWQLIDGEAVVARIAPMAAADGGAVDDGRAAA